MFVADLWAAAVELDRRAGSGVTDGCAILDRLAMHAIRIHITGPSWRQHIAKTRAAERAPST